MLELSECRIAVVGLGYVGLPLAAEFGKQRTVIGFDIDPVRIAELKNGRDRTREVDVDEYRRVIEQCLAYRDRARS